MKSIPVKPQVSPKSIAHAESALRLPHERDEMADAEAIEPKKIMKQAYKDLQRGLVDTDMHGQRGVEEVVKHTVKAPIKKQKK